MKTKGQSGFSLIELLVVVVVIVIIAVIAVPHLQKAIRADENGNMFASLSSVASTQTTFATQNARFARLSEINNILSLGRQEGNEVVRGKFTISMVPAAPTDVELKTGYVIHALRSVDGEGVVYKYELTTSGRIRMLLPEEELP